MVERYCYTRRVKSRIDAIIITILKSLRKDERLSKEGTAVIYNKCDLNRIDKRSKCFITELQLS